MNTILDLIAAHTQVAFLICWVLTICSGGTLGVMFWIEADRLTELNRHPVRQFGRTN